MTVKEYLAHLSNDEITDVLIYIDYWLKYIHSNNCYVFGNVGDMTIIDNKMLKTDKYDYLDSGIEPEGDLNDILELCCIGICAYNHFKHVDYKFTEEFINYVSNNLDLFVNNGKVPRIMREYFKEVIRRYKEKEKKAFYLNDYLLEIGYFDKEANDDNGRERGKTKVKTSPAGMALGRRDDEAAYVRALILPSIIVLVYLVLLVGYFIFF